MNKKKRAEPNKAVEMWKDAIYRDTISFSGEKLDCYFRDKAESLLKAYGLNPRKNKAIKRAII